ncbi:MAG TPA: uroporphyrinogen decarboxylase family protein, partial [Anaerolineae bacterium]
MNARERVLAAIDHREPDRLPVDLGATPSSGISCIAYDRLIKRLGLSNRHNRVYDVVQEVTQPEGEVLDHFRIDVIDVGRAFNTEDSDWYDFTLPDGTAIEFPRWFRPERRPDASYAARKNGEVLARMPEGANFFDQAIWPWVDGYPDDFSGLDAAMNRVLWQAFVHSPWDNAGGDDFWQQLRARALRLRANTDRALVVVAGCNLFEWGTFIRRIDNFLMDLATCPGDVERLLDALMERHLATLEKVCAAVGDVVDVIRMGDDLGTDKGPFMSPTIYRRLFKPRHTMLCDYIKKHSQMRTFLHSCGSIHKLMPDLIEAGYDVINPVQITARDMEPAKLKAEFGKD